MPPMILTILGHPLADSYGAALARAYQQGVQNAGCEAPLLTLADVRFDARRHPHHPPAEGLEPDLLAAQTLLLQAQRWRLIFPVWSGAYPALMKAFFDCALSPDVAFSRDPQTQRLQPLLRGKTAGFIATMNTPPWLYRWALGDCGLVALKRCALGVCGVQTTDIARVGPVRRMEAPARARWLARAEAMGRRDGLRLLRTTRA